MKQGRVIKNSLMVELDEENNYFITKSGVKIYIDNTFEPEKHIVVTGTVVSAPRSLFFKKGSPYTMPWKTPLEIKRGDRVVMYYLAVQNCLRDEEKKYIKENGKYYILVRYNNVYAVIRDNKVIPVNGYILAEPAEDPWKKKKQEYLKKISGIEIVTLQEKSNTDVVFAKAVYIGHPNTEYANSDFSDENIPVKEGDLMVMKKVRDIPVEYEYHSKIDKGRKLYRIQRHDILAIL